MGKEENAGYQHFLYFPQCFQKALSSRSLKVGIVWYRVKGWDTSNQPFTTKSKVLKTKPTTKALKNIVGEGDNDGNHHFSPFQPFQETYSIT